MKNARAKRAKLLFYCQICKFVMFLLPSSSRLLKLPTENCGRRPGYPLLDPLKNLVETGALCEFF